MSARPLTLLLNGRERGFAAEPGETLLRLLRRSGCLSVKFSDEWGEGGSDTVLLDGEPVSASVTLAHAVAGRAVETLEGLRGDPELARLAEIFDAEGAVQCGYCTPAMLLVLSALRRRNPSPSEGQIRRALEGVLCRCTGYVKPLRAALIAAGLEERRAEVAGDMRVVGRDTRRLDGPGLLAGAAVFADDRISADTLHLKILKSPHPHAIIKAISSARALALDGVVDVATWEDVPDRVYSTAGQGFPEPSPYDARLLDRRVRFAGDKVAFVVAETAEIAAAACDLIDVEYEPLPFFLDPRFAQDAGAPALHGGPRPDDRQADILFWPADPASNLAARTDLTLGDPQAGFAASSSIVEHEYVCHQVQNCSIEPHICQSRLDESGRLVIISSSQVQFHVRRIVARLLDLPVSRVRVHKPRVGGGFGGKQEILGEEFCAFMTLRTGRPVRLELTREEELNFARSRHPMRIRYRAGFDEAHRLLAMEMDILSNTGAYGTHALTVMSVCANKGMSLYPAPNVLHRGRAVYSNIVPPGAFRGYGSPQAFWALESFMNEAALELGVDPIELRLANVIQVGDEMKIAEKLGEGRESFPSRLLSGAAAECVARGREAIGWDSRPRGCAPPGAAAGSPLRRGIGMSLVMQGSGIPGIDMAAARLKMNEDGGFNLHVGAVDIGTGSDTVLAQIAAEVLCVPVSSIILSGNDTDTMPFDTGAYASSTTYVSGGAVKKAAERLRSDILNWSAEVLATDAARLSYGEGGVSCPDGRRLTLAEIGTRSLYTDSQRQLMASASHLSLDSPPPFAAQFAEIEVDTETGEIRLLHFVTAVDAGRVLNPLMAEGQVEGAVAQGIGYALLEEMRYGADGCILPRSFREHGFPGPSDLPPQTVIFAGQDEPTGPFGAKAIAEICINGPAPAIGNALADACGARVRELPLGPDRVLTALLALRAPRA